MSRGGGGEGGCGLGIAGGVACLGLVVLRVGAMWVTFGGCGECKFGGCCGLFS